MALGLPGGERRLPFLQAIEALGAETLSAPEAARRKRKARRRDKGGRRRARRSRETVCLNRAKLPPFPSGLRLPPFLAGRAFLSAAPPSGAESRLGSQGRSIAGRTANLPLSAAGGKTQRQHDHLYRVRATAAGQAPSPRCSGC